jgi:hypothetical protein
MIGLYVIWSGSNLAIQISPSSQEPDENLFIIIIASRISTDQFIVRINKTSQSILTVDPDCLDFLSLITTTNHNCQLLHHPFYDIPSRIYPKSNNTINVHIPISSWGPYRWSFSTIGHLSCFQHDGYQQAITKPDKELRSAISRQITASRLPANQIF